MIGSDVERRSPERSWSTQVRRALASLRVRVVVGYLLLLTTGLLAAALVTRQVQLSRADREIQREQAQEVEELRRLANGINPSTSQPFADDVTAIFVTFLRRNVSSDDEAFYTIVNGARHQWSNGSPPLFDDPQFLPAWNVDTPTTWTTTSDVSGVGEVRSLAVPLFTDTGAVAGVFVVASFPAANYAEVDQIVRLIALVGLAVLLVTAAVAWSLAGRVLRPVRDLTTTARRITESDLSARIPVDGHDELAELGATFNDMVSRLENGFNAQRRFLDDVAHELRTPITIARGHLEVLGDDPIERSETIEIVTDELDRMSRYVSELLILAKAEQPDFLVVQPVDLGELALDVHQRARMLGDRTWVLDAAPQVGLIAVLADPDRLAQAMLNLAANAVQHTEPGSEIGLGVDVSGSSFLLWVRDEGSGVDPSLVDSIFDRYSRAATSRTSRPEGTGLGLSIVDAIARAHGGQASVVSQPGHGATFILSIPLAAESSDSPWPPPNSPTASVDAQLVTALPAPRLPRSEPE